MIEKNTKKDDLNKLTPREIVAELDKYIVGQKKAKRAVVLSARKKPSAPWPWRCATESAG